jgi:hypothetical protein
MRDRGIVKPILLLGGIYFGVFAIVAFAFRRLDVSQEALSVVGGVLAYAFLMSVAVVAFVRWRSGRRGGPTS